MLWFAGITAGAAVLRSILGTDQSPGKVFEVKLLQYADRHVMCREDGLILYEPQKNAKQNEKKFEIILQRPWNDSITKAFCLFRSESREDAEVRFLQLKSRLPAIIDFSKDLYSTGGLQKVCDTIGEHPGWNLAHLVAYFGLNDSLNNPLVSTYLNSSDPDTGMSPLQVAIKATNLKTVQLMVDAKCSLEHLDNEGNSVFHYAAVTNKDIIQVLNKDSPQCLSLRNKNGHTPLHVACRNDKPECVKALIVAGADVNKSDDDYVGGRESSPAFVGEILQSNANKLYNKDIKNGGTPLHWACSREAIDLLIDANCDIDARNFIKQTALSVMVRHKRLECVVALLSRGADTDVTDDDGNTPLHLAMKDGYIPIIQSLIVFGANLNYQNNKGETPRHVITKAMEPKVLYYLHAVGALRCSEGMSGCTDGCSFNGTYNGIPPPPVMGPTNRDKLNQMLAVAAMEAASLKNNVSSTRSASLLCLDGGGIRGLVLTQMLLELEEILGKPIIECFDWIAGTSTGGILALALATGKTLKECMCLYFRMKQQTFVGLIRPYSSEPLEKVLKDSYGSETVMSSIKHPKLIITGVLADRKPVELHLFRNYESPSNILKVECNSPFELPPPPEEQLVWHVGRATGAAPSYFGAFERYLDGGLIANNPTLDALTEIHEYNLALRAQGQEDKVKPVNIVVSLGTGLIPVSEVSVIDICKPESFSDGFRLAFKLRAMGTLLVDQATLSDGRVVDRARAWCSMVGIPYFRFSPQMSEEIAMDETSDEKLVKMLWEAKSYMHSNRDVMIEIAALLNKV